MKIRALLFVIGGLAGASGAYSLMPSLDQSDVIEDPRSEPSVAPRPASEVLSMQSRYAVITSTASNRIEVNELQRRIESDPLAALLDAAALTEPAERRRAVMVIGALWARADPEAALQASRNLPVGLRADFLASVSFEWANLDAEGFLDYASGASDLEALTEGLTLLIASDPARVFEIAGRLPPEIGSATLGGMNALQRAALSALADRDPEAAMGHVESMLPQININFVAQDVVSRFARNDPDAALEWLDSLDAVTNSHLRVVLGGIARVDFARAFRLAAAEPMTMGLLDSALANGALTDPVRTARVATDLLNEESDLAVQVLGQLAASWARRDPEDLADWFLANTAFVDPPLTQTIASQLAASDLQAAMGLVDRLPLDMRNVWIGQIAGPYASQDPLAALDWIEQYRGQPFYEDVHSQVVMQVADADPELAATMIGGLPPALRSAAAPRIAGAMSAKDPEAAAEWALGLTDSEAASGAVSRVVSGWIRSDVESAADWVIGLERGAVRDDALSALISGSYGTNLDPRPILDEIDSEETRRQAMRMAVYRSAPNRLEIARELLESMLDDPEDGQWARDFLERIGESGN